MKGFPGMACKGVSKNSGLFLGVLMRIIESIRVCFGAPMYGNPHIITGSEPHNTYPEAPM